MAVLRLTNQQQTSAGAKWMRFKRRFNVLTRQNGVMPTQIASTIIGVSPMAQLDENVDAFSTILLAELLAKIDAVRWLMRDPAV